MKIGIIVHSVTGNTLKVSRRLEERLSAKGHEVTLAEIKTAGKVEFGQTDAEFTTMPEIKGYDLLIFGSHTEAFQLETTMKLYFNKLETMEGKAICLVTHQFPFKWLGGNGAVNKMKALCEEKGLEVVGKAVVDWSPEKKRENKIEAAVKYIVGLID
jgi:flavodoxin